jgi:hypothetical protein
MTKKGKKEDEIIFSPIYIKHYTNSTVKRIDKVRRASLYISQLKHEKKNQQQISNEYTP